MGNPINWVDPLGNKISPECLKAILELVGRIVEIINRINDLLNDPEKLYLNHRYKWQAHEDYGSYVGHQEQLDGKRKNLSKLIKDAIRKCKKKDDCDEDKDAYDQYDLQSIIGKAEDVINIPTPQSPGGNIIPSPW